MTRIGQRLFLAALPGALGVSLVAELAYGGKSGREGTQSAFILATVVTLVAMALAWHNSRWSASDSRVESPGAALVTRAEESERRARAAEARETEYAAMTREVMKAVSARVEEARLPLHVLLLSPFGLLNENQEEMLSAARSALESADIAIGKLSTLIALDRREVTVIAEGVEILDILDVVVSGASDLERARNVTVEAHFPTVLPRAAVDVPKLHAALAAVLSVTLTSTPDGEAVSVTADADSERVRINIRGTFPLQPDELPLDLYFAHRLIRAQNGSMRQSSGEVVIELPADNPIGAMSAGGE